MLIDSKGKLFGKISVIDVIIFLIIIGLGVGIYFRFFTLKTETKEDKVFYYSVKVEGVRKTNIEAMKKSLKSLFYLDDYAIITDMGTLIDVKYEPAKGLITKNNGDFVIKEIPERYDAYLTFKVKGYFSENAYYTEGLREITVGSTYGLKSKYTLFNSSVQKVWE